MSLIGPVILGGGKDYNREVHFRFVHLPYGTRVGRHIAWMSGDGHLDRYLRGTGYRDWDIQNVKGDAVSVEEFWAAAIAARLCR